MYIPLNGSAAGAEPPTAVGCRGWPAVHHRLFQLAHLFFLAAFVVPHTFRLSAAALRALLCAGLTLVAVWAGAVVCAPDALAWSVALAVVNAAYAARQVSCSRPERAPAQLRPLHRRLFAPLRVPAAEFARLVRGAELRRLARGELFAAEGVTRTGGRLAILLTGELVVSCEGCPLHRITPHQFINSPEWEADEAAERDSKEMGAEQNCKPPDPNPIYQVSISATEESTYVVWTAEVLGAVLQSNAFLNAVLFNLVGEFHSGAEWLVCILDV
ncbi:Blood vessel epicardial substance [Amphibalanus amphitrite]|uniref:Blood vessel epicardial substance n=1 Tax=Amphibalanus amphitrite TaxID=1232801 RepID=A0A6A4WAN4_AMPAM|nr:Blood vessel epicardial substance [Amphibalanus amphitrite]